MAVQSQTGERSRLMLDIAEFRKNHRAEIAEIAKEAVADVLETGDEIALDPMNPFERKVVHDIVAASGLISDSEGVGPNRHVIIKPADSDGAVVGGGVTAESADSADLPESAASAEAADAADDEA